MYPTFQKKIQICWDVPFFAKKNSIKMYPTSQENLKVISWDVSLLQK